MAIAIKKPLGTDTPKQLQYFSTISIDTTKPKIMCPIKLPSIITIILPCIAGIPSIIAPMTAMEICAKMKTKKPKIDPFNNEVV